MLLNFKKSLPYLGGFLGVVVLATAAFVGGMWYRGQLTLQPQPQQESCEDCVIPFPAPDTSNWKTYHNEELGFEMKYPEHAEVLEFSTSPVEACSSYFQVRIRGFNEIGDLFTMCKRTGLSLEKYPWKQRIWTEHQISGLYGERNISPSSMAPPNFGFVDYVFEFQGNLWSITFYNTSPELYINWTDAVVSTFRFIE